MDPSPGSNVCEQKRQPKPTAKALANKMEHLQKDRKAKVKKIEAIGKEIHVLMQSSDNVETIQSHLHNVSALYDEASQLHDSVIPLLPPEEQEKQNAWFSKIQKHKVDLIENANKWLSDANGQLQSTVQLHGDATPVSPPPPPAEAPPQPPPAEAPTDVVTNDVTVCISEHLEAEVGTALVDDVSPYDSISNVAVQSSKKRSTAGSKASSTTSSARVLAEAEMAALLARQKLLAEKHALEEEEELHRKAMEEQQAQHRKAMEEREAQLRKKREKLNLEMEIAASAAKLNVLKVSSISRMSVAAASEADGMNSYIEKKKQNVPHTLDADAETFVPASVGPPVTQPSHFAFSEQSRSHLLDARPKQPLPLLPDARPKVTHVGLQSQLGPETVGVQQSRKPNRPARSQPQLQLNPPARSHSQLHPSLQPRSQPLLQSNRPVPSAQGGADPGQLISVLEKQNEITSLLAEQQSLFFLPRRDIQIFDGDPLEYQTFMRAFEHCIEEKTQSAKDCLYFLEQYTKGQPREMVRSCQHMPAGSGYAMAKSLLQEHFGNSLKITSAYMDKVFSWPVLKSEDVQALQSYSFLLRSCCNALGEFESTYELDVPANMQAVIKKLPYKLREKWREVAYSLQERYRRRATFGDIVAFIERQVKMATDPLFGDLQDSSPAVPKKEMRPAKSQSFPEPRSSFGTTVDTVNSNVDTGLKRENGSSVDVACLLCGAGHSLDTCRLLERKTHDEKMSFLREKRVCFGCMCIGHRSKDCHKRLVCNVCSKRHPTMLHVYKDEEGSMQVQGEAGAADENALIAVQSSCLTGAGESDCSLAILPVRVRSKKSHKTVVTYAFLDPGSSASFVTEGLMNRLNLTGRRTDILLRTMGQESVVSSHMVLDLEVAGLDTDGFCELPVLFTQKCMPVHQGNIPGQEDLRRWPHLEHLKITGIDSGVDLLIGTNVPKALEPWEVVRSEDGGPFAVRTMLGWTVNGPLGGDCTTARVSHDVSVNRISVERPGRLWEQQQQKVDVPECVQPEQGTLDKPLTRRGISSTASSINSATRFLAPEVLNAETALDCLRELHQAHCDFIIGKEPKTTIPSMELTAALVTSASGKVDSVSRSDTLVAVETECPEKPERVSPEDVSGNAVQAYEQADLDMFVQKRIRFKRSLDLAWNRRLPIQLCLGERLHKDMQTSVATRRREEMQTAMTSGVGGALKSHWEHSCSGNPFSLGALELFELLSLSITLFISLFCRRRGEYG